MFDIFHSALFWVVQDINNKIPCWNKKIRDDTLTIYIYLYKQQKDNNIYSLKNFKMRKKRKEHVLWD